MIIGVTGPVGSGKNEVSKILSRRGAFIIDADLIGHELLQESWPEIVSAFGSKMLRPVRLPALPAGRHGGRQGKVNRKKLGELVFSDSKALQKLNRIVHPKIKQKIIQELETRAKMIDNQKPIVINAALIKELGLLDVVDEVWLVFTSRERRIKWALGKGRLTKEKLKNIMKNQMLPAEYLEIADRVIKNSGTKKDLEKEVNRLWADLI